MGNEEEAAYFETFDSLFLSIPGGVAEGDATKKRKVENGVLAVKRNAPVLNDPWLSVAQEALELVTGIRTPRLYGGCNIGGFLPT